MRYWKTMMAGGAAMLMSVGSARAGVDAAKPAARQATSWDAKGSAPADPARANADAVNVAASGDDRSVFVTHEELDRFSRELLERLQRERNAQQAAPPTFTDAG